MAVSVSKSGVGCRGFGGYINSDPLVQSTLALSFLSRERPSFSLTVSLTAKFPHSPGEGFRFP